ncbi:MAG: glycoside hydrolase family 2 TIM barrel-domain containing protein [Planctomycetota bacterium]
MNSRLAVVLGALVVAASAVSQSVPVEVTRSEDGFQLLRGGEPYFVKGAGGRQYLELLAASGANSIRTWGQGDLEPREWPDGRTMSLLDRAHELGLTVTAGFWIPHFPGGYQGGGFDYDDEEAADQLVEDAREFARKWKDHPALLAWGVGNEPLGTDRERGLRLVNRVAKAMNEVDPDHPTVAVLAGIWPDKASLFAELCPDVDILGINVYGGAPVIPEQLLEQGYDGPYLMCEYGALGYWEVDHTPWGAEIEQASDAKAAFYRRSHLESITAAPDRCLGGYVFLWGYKQERTDTWFSMLMPGGERTPSADAMIEIWTGEPPSNRAPVVSDIVSDLKLARVPADTLFDAAVVVTDHEDDPLTITWDIKPEGTDKGAGGAFERTPESLAHLIQSSDGLNVVVRTPDSPGPYRLKVYVRDGQGGVGAWNVPFYVEARE